MAYRWPSSWRPLARELCRQRRADFLSGLADAAFEAAWGPEIAFWLDRLSQEHDNFRAALAWLLAAGRIQQACLMAAALEPLWTVRGHLNEGQRWLRQCVA